MLKSFLITTFLFITSLSLVNFTLSWLFTPFTQIILSSLSSWIGVFLIKVKLFLGKQNINYIDILDKVLISEQDAIDGRVNKVMSKVTLILVRKEVFLDIRNEQDIERLALIVVEISLFIILISITILCKLLFDDLMLIFHWFVDEDYMGIKYGEHAVLDQFISLIWYPSIAFIITYLVLIMVFNYLAKKSWISHIIFSDNEMLYIPSSKDEPYFLFRYEDILMHLLAGIFISWGIGGLSCVLSLAGMSLFEGIENHYGLSIISVNSPEKDVLKWVEYIKYSTLQILIQSMLWFMIPDFLILSEFHIRHFAGKLGWTKNWRIPRNN